MKARVEIVAEIDISTTYRLKDAIGRLLENSDDLKSLSIVTLPELPPPPAPPVDDSAQNATKPTEDIF